MGVNVPLDLPVGPGARARHEAQGGGLFLNTGSISSVVGIPGRVPMPRQRELAQITRQMAIEYAADHIRSNAVCPGTVDTPMLRKAAARFRGPRCLPRRPLRRPPHRPHRQR